MAERLMKRKTGIRYKVIGIICFSTLIVMSIGIVMWYFFNLKALSGMIGDAHRKMSQLLANDLSIRLEDEAARIKGYAGGAQLSDAAATAGILEAIVSGDDEIAGAAIIDPSGAITASSEKNDKPYKSDAKAVKALISGANKSCFIGDIEFDNALKAWAIPVYAPVRGADGMVSGLLKAKLSVKRFFSPLESFRIDTTGRAIVIDNKGNVLFYPKPAPTNFKLFNDAHYQRLLTSKNKYAIIYEPNVSKQHMFVAFSEVIPKALLDSDKAWRVLIGEDSREVFAPINRMIPKLIAAILLLVIIMVGVGFVFSGVLVRPIESLYSAALEISKGNWEHRIEIKTGDEIEQFADAFKEMVSNIRDKQEKLLKAKEELERLSKSLEEKVAARTIDLTMAKDKISNYAKELEKAIMVKSDFISMASHELRTPLAAIREGVNIVMDERTGAISPKQKEFLMMAKRNLDRLSRIINEILDFQKLEEGKMTLSLQDNDINAVAEDACRTMSPVAQEKRLALVKEFANNMPGMKFDKDKITQVLINLISNAINFTERGSVTVRTSAEKKLVKVSVKDTGIGISEDDMPQLFQKFTQLDIGPERRTGGTGLGLTISKAIIEKHGGNIWVESKPGKGATFYFTLPVLSDAAARDNGRDKA